MMSIKKILCPTDFSHFSMRALVYATELSARFKAKLYVQHVIEDSYIRASTTSVTSADIPMITVLYKHDAEALIKKTFSPDLEYAKIIVVGSPDQEIVKAAEEQQMDLIVMGTHGRTGLNRLFVGSVTEQVLRKAPCPVMTISHVPEERTRRPLDFRTLLVPINFSEPSFKALEFALGLAQEYRSVLYILILVERLQWLEMGAHVFDPSYKERYLESIQRNLTWMIPEKIKKQYRVKELAKFGSTAHEIVDTAEEIHADLIIMGEVGYSAIKSALFGSTAYRVVKEAHCPVLTMKG